MLNVSQALILVLMAGVTFGACGGKAGAGNEQSVDNQRAGGTTETAEATTPSQSTKSTSIGSGFDINKVAIANPQLGKFPYVSLIDGYQRAQYGTAVTGGSKEVNFDRYEFFDGAKINTVEGRLSTIEAEGQGASAFQVFKTYESLFTGLGGVKVFEGKAERLGELNLEFSDVRHRHPVYGDDQMGVYVIRTPDREIWLEAYVRQYSDGRTYFLTVVEKKNLEVKASLLPAEEMKRELDAKGHVALYINFDFDKADIKPESRPIIDQIVKLLRNNPGLNLAVEGHTDNIGTPAYNKKLSDARAKSVVAAVTAEGIEARRLQAAGYGQDKPIAENSTDEGRAKNRRVELVKTAG